jgi:ADP-heptose:LPS heptosyltransferase
LDPARLGDAPRKIAVLHAKALGDFIVTLPALGAIKESYPDAELVLLAKPWVKEFLAARPSVIDRVVCVPEMAGVNDPIERKGRVPDYDFSAKAPEIDRFFQFMQAEKFDLAIHMQGDGKSANPFINKLGAAHTIGMCNRGAQPLHRSIPYVHYQSEVLRNLEIAALAGANTSRLEPRIEVTVADEAEASPIFEIIKGKPYVVIHSGADDERRVWPAGKFAEVSDALTDRGYEIILTGTPKEERTVAGIVQAMRHKALPCMSLKLGGLAALLRKSALVVSNDTGPLHLARAVGAATVGIYWGPNVLNWGPLSRNRHRLAISWRVECPGCGVAPVRPWPFLPATPDCDHPYSFVEGITVTEVLALADELLNS